MQNSNLPTRPAPTIVANPQTYSAPPITGYSSAPVPQVLPQTPGGYNVGIRPPYYPQVVQAPPRPPTLPITSPPIRTTLRPEGVSGTLAPLPFNEKPQTSVYVGKIPSTVDDAFLTRIFGLCGFVRSWKRAVDPTSNIPKSFGFCEFEAAEGALRALRLLHNFSLDGQQLVINVTQVTREYLERYVIQKKANSRGPRLDLSDLKKVLEMNLEEGKIGEEPAPEKEKKSKGQNKAVKEVLTEEQRKNMEIRAFGLVLISDKSGDDSALRVINALVEERKKILAEEAEKPEKEEGEADGEKDLETGELKEDERGVEASTGGKRGGDKYRERSMRDSDRLYFQKEREWENREKEKEREREWEKERGKKREKERRKLVKYQEEMSDDEGDFRYRGRAFGGEEGRKRRVLEEEEDLLDKLKEEKEIEEAKKRRVEEEKITPIFRVSEVLQGVDLNPQLGFKAVETTNVQGSAPVSPPPPPLISTPPNAPPEALPEPQISPKTEEKAVETEKPPEKTPEPPLPVSVSLDLSKASREKEGTQGREEAKKKLGFNLQSSGKRVLVSAFGQEEDEENKKDKKRPLVPIDYGEDEKTFAEKGIDSSLAAAADFARRLSGAQEKTTEKPTDAKALIDSIPKGKDELFGFDLNWTVFDKNNLKEKIRPWVAKKIREYLGEEESSLIEFIVSHTEKHVKASEMLQLLEPVLDEEAEMFVVKMWRMIIFEVKRIELGLLGGK